MLTNGAFPFSGQFYEVRTGSDTVTAIVTNVDADAVTKFDNASRTLELRVTTGTPAGSYQSLANGLKFSLAVSNLDAWRTWFLSSLSKSDIPRILSNAFPNPLRLFEASNLLLPVTESPNQEGEVFILTSSLDLAFSDHFSVTESSGARYLMISTRTLQSRLNSGVYFIVARVGGNEYQWKVAVIQ